MPSSSTGINWTHQAQKRLLTTHEGTPMGRPGRQEGAPPPRNNLYPTTSLKMAPEWQVAVHRLQISHYRNCSTRVYLKALDVNVLRLRA